MRWRDTCELVNIAYEQDDEGVLQPTESVNVIFCNSYSVATQAWSTAKLADTQMDTEIQIRSDEYQEEQDVRFRNRRYSVVKVMDQGEFTRLTLKRYDSDKEASDA